MAFDARQSVVAAADVAVKLLAVDSVSRRSCSGGLDRSTVLGWDRKSEVSWLNSRWRLGV